VDAIHTVRDTIAKGNIEALNGSCPNRANSKKEPRGSFFCYIESKHFSLAFVF
jgi:hypothetical protein